MGLDTGWLALRVVKVKPSLLVVPIHTSIFQHSARCGVLIAMFWDVWAILKWGIDTCGTGFVWNYSWVIDTKYLVKKVAGFCWNFLVFHGFLLGLFKSIFFHVLGISFENHLHSKRPSSYTMKRAQVMLSEKLRKYSTGRVAREGCGGWWANPLILLPYLDVWLCWFFWGVCYAYTS